METKEVAQRHQPGFREPDPINPLKLEQRFSSCWKDPASSNEVWRTLADAYSGPYRQFHTLQHIGECLQVADQYAAIVGWPELPPELELAIWFHDVVYEPGAKNNEQRSAKLFQDLALETGLDFEVVEGASSLILETKDHEARGVPLSSIMCDCDLWILGAAPERYSEYVEALHHEYAGIPRWLFKRGRRAFLMEMLGRGSLYTLPLFEDAFSRQATENMRRELTRLECRGRGASCGAG